MKFPGQGEHREVCAIEQLYAELARDCASRFPRAGGSICHPGWRLFGVCRFDRERGMRVPMHSLASLLQVDFRLPGSTDYTALLRATRMLTRDEREVQKAYARAVFNACSTTGTTIPETLHGGLDRTGSGNWLLRST